MALTPVPKRSVEDGRGPVDIRAQLRASGLWSTKLMGGMSEADTWAAGCAGADFARAADTVVPAKPAESKRIVGTEPPPLPPPLCRDAALPEIRNSLSEGMQFLCALTRRLCFSPLFLASVGRSGLGNRLRRVWRSMEVMACRGKLQLTDEERLAITRLLEGEGDAAGGSEGDDAKGDAEASSNATDLLAAAAHQRLPSSDSESPAAAAVTPSSSLGTTWGSSTALVRRAPEPSR
eukprot:SAG11_NODE_8678_length_988_cov_1.004499_1_plen_235_part_00